MAELMIGNRRIKQRNRGDERLYLGAEPAESIPRKWWCVSLYRCFIVLTFSSLATLSLIMGCGYVSTSSYLEHIESIRIPTVEIQDPDIFYDEASRPYDEIIQEKLTQQFNRKWQDGNDSELTLKILDYNVREQEYGPNGEVEMVRMSLQVEYEFLDRVRDTVIAKTDNHFQIHDFYVVPNRAEPPETVAQARTRLIDELIKDLYNQLAEQW